MSGAEESNRKSRDKNSVAYEKRDADFPRIAALGGGLFVMIALVYVVCIGVLHLFQNTQPAGGSAVERTARLPPEPRLQVDPARDLTAMKEEENGVLNHYGWINRSQGQVHIPIGQAIDVLARRGLPTRSTKSTGGP